MKKRQRKKFIKKHPRQHYQEEKPEEELYTQIMAGIGRAEEFEAQHEIEQDDEPRSHGYVDQDGEKAA